MDGAFLVKEKDGTSSGLSKETEFFIFTNGTINESVRSGQKLKQCT